MFLKKWYLLLLLLVLGVSCSNVDDSPTVTPIEDNNKDSTTVSKGAFEKGIIIPNEGNFMTPNASVSFISDDYTKKHDSIYYKQNNGALVGDVLQSITFYKDKAFLIVNNSNRILVVNRYTFKKEHEITEKVEQPRYATIIDNKLFVTNIISQSVVVYNATTYAFLKQIKIGENLEHIVTTNNKVYVEKSYFRSGNGIAVINPSTYNIDKTIVLNDTLNAIIVSKKNNALYALTSLVKKDKSEQSYLYKIDPQTDSVSKKNNLENVESGRKLCLDNNSIYFVDTNKVFQLPETNFLAQPKKLFEVPANSWSTFYGFNVINNKVYSGDAKGFVANGQVSIYDLQGNLQKQFLTAIGPNNFYKN